MIVAHPCHHIFHHRVLELHRAVCAHVRRDPWACPPIQIFFIFEGQLPREAALMVLTLSTLAEKPLTVKPDELGARGLHV